MGEFRTTDQKYCFDVIPNDVIELADGLLIVKIRGVAQPADNVMRICFFTKVNSKSFKSIYFDSWLIFKDLLDPVAPFFNIKEGLLLRIYPYCHNDLIK